MIVLEDLDHIGGKNLGHKIKIWADRGVSRLPVKGAMVWSQHQVLVVTSNYSIDEIFGPDGDR